MPQRISASLSQLVVWTILLGVCLVSTATTQADVVRLKSGGEVRGKILSPETGKKTTDQPVVVQTLTGGQISLAAADVEFLTRRSLVFEEHEWLVRFAHDTVEGHWKLQEWCRDRGLRTDRENHLRAIVALDPFHEPARKLLGHVFYEQKWMTRDEMMTAKGLVKYKGKYVFKQELEVLEVSAEHREAEREWHRKIHQWRDWLVSGPNDKTLFAKKELEKLADPRAVRPLSKLLRDVPVEAIRGLYVECLGRIGGKEAAQALAIQALHDESAIVREAALNSIPKSEHDLVAPIFAKALQDEVNSVVQRGAVALAHLGDRESIPALIEALNTSHLYQVQVTDRRPIPGMITAPLTQPVPSSKPVVLPTSPLASALGIPTVTAQPPPPVAQPSEIVQTQSVVVRREHQNQAVLAALRSLTEQDYGYDERTWRLWWTSQNGFSSPTTAVKKS